MMLNPARLLAFAFANADFLFEMDPNAKITFATGAANDLVTATGKSSLIGSQATELFKPQDGVAFSSYANALKPGERSGPFKLTLATGADASLSLI